MSKTPEELSLICPRYLSIQSEKNSPNWKCLKVAGPLDFNLTGILNGLSDTLTKAKISIYAISTFDTDYLLLQKQVLKTAKTVLKRAEYGFE
ncbi:MAG: ACT domain-containing protein [SAR324 cluster bacterium]|nr:ACT domain-containing protein [SAR324 cluster bacterium]